MLILAFLYYIESMGDLYAVNSNIGGVNCSIDPQTGMIEVDKIKGFTIKRKVMFLELAKKLWPNISLICEHIGIASNTYRAHYNVDRVFRDKITAIEEAVTDNVEAKLAEYALEKANFMDRIAWLRAHRGSKYNEKRMIQVDVNMTQDKIEAKQASLLSALDTSIIDAEIVAPVNQAVKQEIKQEPK